MSVRELGNPLGNPLGLRKSSSVQLSGRPVGAIQHSFPAPMPPTEWLPLNGQTILSSDFPHLVSALNNKTVASAGLIEVTTLERSEPGIISLFCKNNYVFVGYSIAPYMKVFKLNAEGQFTQLPSPSFSPSITGALEDAVFGIDGDFMFCALSFSNYHCRIAKINTTTDQITGLADPVGTYTAGISSTIRRLAMSGDGKSIVVSIGNEINMLTRIGDAVSIAYLFYVGSNATGISLSRDGEYLAVADASEAGARVFKKTAGGIWPGSQTAFLWRLAVDLPSGSQLAFSPTDDYIAVTSTTGTYIYSKAASWNSSPVLATRINIYSNQSPQLAERLVISDDGNVLSAGYNNSPYLSFGVRLNGIWSEVAPWPSTVTSMRSLSAFSMGVERVMLIHASKIKFFGDPLNVTESVLPVAANTYIKYR